MKALQTDFGLTVCLRVVYTKDIYTDSIQVTGPPVDQFEVVSTYFGPSDPRRVETSGIQNFEGYSTRIISDPLLSNEPLFEDRGRPSSTEILDEQFETPSWYYGPRISNGFEPSSVDEEHIKNQDTLPIRAVRFGNIDIIPDARSFNKDIQPDAKLDDYTNMHITEFAMLPQSTIHENDERKDFSGYSNFDVMMPHTNADTEQLIATDKYQKRTPVYGFSNEIFQNYQQTPILRLQENESQNQFYFAYDESRTQDHPLPTTDEALYIADDYDPKVDKSTTNVNNGLPNMEPLYAHHSQDRQYQVGEGRMWGGGLNNSQLFGLGGSTNDHSQTHSTNDNSLTQPSYIYLSGVSNNSFTEDGDLSLDSRGQTNYDRQIGTKRSNGHVQNYDNNITMSEMSSTQQSRLDKHPVDYTEIQHSGQPIRPSRQPVQIIGLGHDYEIVETRFPSYDLGYPLDNHGTNPPIVISHVPQEQPNNPYMPVQDLSTHNLRIEGVEENESSTEAGPVIGQDQLTDRQHKSNSGRYSQYLTSSKIQQSQTNRHPQFHTNMEVFAGQFENVAKMSRLAPSSGGSKSEKAPPPVKVRPVYYSPGPDAPTYRHSESDSRSDASTPRPPRPRGDRPMSGREGQRVFYRAPFTGEPPGKVDEHSIEDKAGLEKWRNKQRQREFKQKLSKEEMDDDRKENRRRRILTRRQRDQLYRGYNDDLYDAYSDIEARYGYRHYASSRSGYSTPGGSCDERNLGRSMRAAPRHVRPARTSSRPASASKDKDLIEMLNRQQHMMLQQREQRHRFLEEQKIKQHAQQVVNRALLHDSFDERKLDNKDTKEMKQLLNDAFPLAGNTHKHLLSSNGIADEERKSAGGDVTPTNYAYQSQMDDVSSKDKSDSNTPTSALNQLMTEGRVSHQSSRKNSSQADNGDFFDTGRKDFPEDDAEKAQVNEEKVQQESEGKYMQAIRDELQRLNTS
ncbi:uncharacterized protein LOC117335713 isoform X2 [Pecten maximus]|uniref:uncharacterized protein LOC117335713 isoform X2 n=1 Tax=Pecten maximus TaxID=6579 RepID=UPI001458BEE2|nr:uncharacterized protein LOC117335713 isoform X2 [Pecten maximus]